MEASMRGQPMEISLAGVKQLTSVHDVERILAQTLAQEAEIEAELADMMRYGKAKLETKLELLEVLPTKLKPVHGKIKDLAEVIADTCVLAETVSSKVRALDRTRGRVEAAQKRVELILDVKNCIEGIDDAMQKEDWERACEYIKTYLSIVMQQGEGESQEEGGEGAAKPTVLDESSNQLLQKKLEELREIIRVKADESKDAAEVQRYCKLFTPLGMPNQGLRRYAAFVRSELKGETYILLTRLRKTINKKASKEEQLTCIDAISMVFETVAHYIEVHSAIVEDAFGPGSTILLLREIQQESDVHSTSVVKIFLEKYDVAKVLDSIQQSQPQGRGRKKDPAELGEVLDAMALFSQRYELYDRFLKAKAASALRKAPTAANGKVQGLHHVLELNRLMQQMVDQYILLESYFISENTAKAIKMDLATPLDASASPLVAPMVDFVFFILQKCHHRALSTFSPQCISAIANLVTQCLSTQLRDGLLSVLQNRAASQAAPAAEDVMSSFIAGLNGLQLSVEYMTKLKVEVEAESANIFAKDETARQQILACLAGISDASVQFKKLFKTNLDQLVAQRITPGVGTLVERFRATSYRINELKFAEYEINDPFAYEFVEGLEHILSFYKPRLAPETFDALIIACLRGITSQLERGVLQKEFTQLGGLQFDKDLRNVVAYFSSVTEKTVRGEFARLIQMASLLNLQQVDEVLEYWGDNSGQMTWRLTPGEVRRVLSRRVDFKAEDIGSLKL